MYSARTVDTRRSIVRGQVAGIARGEGAKRGETNLESTLTMAHRPDLRSPLPPLETATSFVRPVQKQVVRPQSVSEISLESRI